MKLKNEEITGFEEKTFACPSCGIEADSTFQVSVQHGSDSRIHGYGTGNFEKGKKLETIRATKKLLREHPDYHSATLTKCVKCSQMRIYFSNPETALSATGYLRADVINDE